MLSLLKNIKSSDIKQYSKEELSTAFLEIQSKNTKSKELSSKIRILILAIIELSEELKLDYKSTNIQKQLLHTLSTSDNLNYV
ncbi:MAG: hypothetical protein U9Q66_03340 [Patescibacteria group bacterium]|nr:hypothetical protein [Patescibacteria group bacterium]